MNIHILNILYLAYMSTYVRKMMSTVQIATRPNETNFPKLFLHIIFLFFPCSLFLIKEISVYIEIFEKFSSKTLVLTPENSTPSIYLLLELRFLKFSSFPFFWISPIAQSKNSEMVETFSSLKTLNFLLQFLKYSSYICQNKYFNSLNLNMTQID